MSAKRVGEVIKVVLVADGDPRDQATNSGVALGVYDAMQRSTTFDVVGAISSNPPFAVRAAIGLMTFRFPVSRWKNQYRKTPSMLRARSQTRDRKLAEESRVQEIDLLIHVRNTYTPCRLPYANFIDMTSELAHESWSDWSYSKRAMRKRRDLEQRQFDGAVSIWTAAEYVARSVVSDYGQPDTKVCAVGGGNNFAGAGSPRPIAARRRVLFVGMDFARKGGDVAVAAMRIVRESFPDSTLTIVGPEVQPPGTGVASGVTFLGRVRDRVELAQVFGSHDIFCLPAAFEPYGLVVQEAMAHGLACIVSNVGALPEIVDHGRAGLIVEQGDASGLADAILRLMSDPSMADKVAADGHVRSTQMTWDAVVARMAKDLAMARPAAIPRPQDQ